MTIIALKGQVFTIAECRRGTTVREIKQNLQRRTKSLPQVWSLRWDNLTLRDDMVIGRIGISAAHELLLHVEFPVTVRKLDGGEIVIPDCNEYMTVCALKTKIMAITGMPYHHHRLLFEQRPVQNWNKLYVEGIDCNSVLSLVIDQASDSDSDSVPGLILSSDSEDGVN